MMLSRIALIFALAFAVFGVLLTMWWPFGTTTSDEGVPSATPNTQSKTNQWTFMGMPVWLFALGYVTRMFDPLWVFILPFFKVRVYVVENKTKVTGILGVIKHASKWKEDKPSDLVLGKWFVGYVRISGGGRGMYEGGNEIKGRITLVCTEKQYKELMKTATGDEQKVLGRKRKKGSNTTEERDMMEEKVSQSEKEFNLHSRIESCLWRMCYEPEKVKIRAQEYKRQTIVLDKIQEMFEEQGICVALIYGPPGSGKTRLGPYLAARLGGTLVDEWNPSLPGDGFQGMAISAKRSKKTPLVVLLDEVDGILRTIMPLPEDAKMEDRKYPEGLLADISSRATWNKFFERQHEFGQNVIFLLTTNVSPEDLNERERRYMGKRIASCLRPGRVHMMFEMTHDNARVLPHELGETDHS